MALSTISGTTGITDATVTSAKLADFTAAVDLNGVELLLDADQDTSISADTDDRIDFKIAGVEHFSFSNSSGDTVVKPMVDTKDIIFQQYDGNKVFEINDGNFVSVGGNATAAGQIRIYEDTDNGSHYSGFTVGNLTASVTYQLPNADGSNGQAMVTNGSGVLTFTDVSSAADDISAGDAAINLTTTAGDITIDAQGNDTDIILKGTDGSSDTTFLTIDGSAAGEAIFNAGIVIADAGNIGSASDKDAIAISSGGVVTMNQIPVFSAGINVSGGNIAGTLSTAAQANITSLGTLTTLTVDNVITNGTTIGHTDDTDLITLADGIVTVAGEVSLTTLDIGGTNITSTAAEINIIDGNTSATSTTLVDADRFVVNDNGTMVQVAASDLVTYVDANSSAASTGKAIAMAIVFG